jgi:hypothetical protein
MIVEAVHLKLSVSQMLARTAFRKAILPSSVYGTHNDASISSIMAGLGGR